MFSPNCVTKSDVSVLIYDRVTNTQHSMFHLHKNILASTSKVLRKIVEENKEDDIIRLILPPPALEHLGNYFQFIYRELSCDIDNFADLLMYTSLFMDKMLTLECAKLVSSENILTLPIELHYLISAIFEFNWNISEAYHINKLISKLGSAKFPSLSPFTYISMETMEKFVTATITLNRGSKIPFTSILDVLYKEKDINRFFQVCLFIHENGLANGANGKLLQLGNLLAWMIDEKIPYDLTLFGKYMNAYNLTALYSSVPFNIKYAIHITGPDSINSCISGFNFLMSISKEEDNSYRMIFKGDLYRFFGENFQVKKMEVRLTATFKICTNYTFTQKILLNPNDKKVEYNTAFSEIPSKMKFHTKISANF